MKGFPFAAEDVLKLGMLLSIVGLRIRQLRLHGGKAHWYNIIWCRSYPINLGVFLEVVALEPQDPEASPLVVSLGGVAETVHVSPDVSCVKETQEASSGDNDLASTLVFTKSADLPADVGVLPSAGSSEVVSVGLRQTGDAGVLPLLSIVSSEAETTTASSHSQDFGALDWHVKTTQVV